MLVTLGTTATAATVAGSNAISQLLNRSGSCLLHVLKPGIAAVSGMLLGQAMHPFGLISDETQSQDEF